MRLNLPADELPWLFGFPRAFGTEPFPSGLGKGSTLIRSSSFHFMFRSSIRLIFTAAITVPAMAQLSPDVPGRAVSYLPAASAKYVGSPALAKLPDGALIAAHDEFGSGSSQGSHGVTRVFRSSDDGRTWTAVAVISGAFWSNLFVRNGALWLVGTNREYGDAVIRRSTDGGFNWTTPSASTTGLLAGGGQYHCAPVPIVEHDGRLWRAIERRQPASGWAPNFRACMMSVPADADLLDASNWTFSNFLPGQSSWLGGTFGGWLEGNAVVGPEGNLLNLLRVDVPGHPEKAAILSVSPDGSAISFAPSSGFVEMPGAAKKFAIRHDPQSGLYWSLANLVPQEFQSSGNPASVRNTLSLLSSPDLKSWMDRGTVISHPDTSRHGFQYVEWLFDGNDIIATCRTAFDDANGGAANYHDANHLTFHRISNFRDFSGGPLPGPWRHTYSTDGNLSPDGDEDGDGFTNRHEYLAGSNPLRPASTPARMGDTVRVALASGSGIDLYQVTAGGSWSFERRLTTASYQSLLSLGGWLYGAGIDRIDRIDPVTGEATVMAARNSGAALAAGWTSADTQQLAVGPDGMLYFSTAFGAAAGQGVFRLKSDGSGFSRFIARSGNGWDLNNARGLTWSGSGWFVSSRAGTGSTGRPVYEFDSAGQFVRSLRGDLRAPQGLFADTGTLCVAGYTGSLTGLKTSDGNLDTLVSGLPAMNAMSVAELFGEIHVVTYQNGVWRRRGRTALTPAFTAAATSLAAMAVIPQSDPYDMWIARLGILTGTGKTDDPDHDGVPNGLEYLLGWDPADGASRFAATLAPTANGGMSLSWPSAPGAVFTVRSSSDLHDWSTIEAVVTGSPGETTGNLELPPATEKKRFYRVEWTN